VLSDPRITHADCLDWLPTLEAESADSCVTDPPYELGFMGKAWDRQGIAVNVEMWEQVFRVLKPGAHLLAFGGTRTYHRLVCAIEDAGFEIRDSIAWLYGQGFPKSLDVSKAIDRAAGAERGPGIRVPRSYPDSDRWKDPEGARAGGTKSPTSYPGSPHDDLPGKVLTAPATAEAARWSGWGTALKPAMELICVARKPLSERTVAANVLRWGTGAVNVDGCRIETNGEKVTINTWDDGAKPFGGGAGHPYSGREQQGRWPANLCLDEEAAAALDQQSGEREVSGSAKLGRTISTRCAPNGMFQTSGGGPLHNDHGGASRFFLRVTPDWEEQCNLCLHLAPKHDTMIETPEGEVSCETANGAAKSSLPPNPAGASVVTSAADSPQPQVGDNAEELNSPVLGAGGNGRTMPATSGSIAQRGVPDLLVEEIALRVKSAGILCDSCATAIARSLVLIRQGHAPESLPFPAYISERRKRILSRVLALYVAGRESTDIILTTESLTMLLGSARSAIADCIISEKSAANSECAPTRFRYCSKASRAEREAGCEGLPSLRNDFQRETSGLNQDRPNREGRSPATIPRNGHPTIKPLALMRWLVRLVTPPGGTILEPFAGSGTTCIAAGLEGFDFLACEREEEYVQIAEARLAHWVDERLPIGAT